MFLFLFRIANSSYLTWSSIFIFPGIVLLLIQILNIILFKKINTHECEILIPKLGQCILDIEAWLTAYDLKLNEDKTRGSSSFLKFSTLKFILVIILSLSLALMRSTKLVASEIFLMKNFTETLVHAFITCHHDVQQSLNGLPNRRKLSFNGYKIPRLDFLPTQAPMIITSLLYFAISIGFQWNIALYTKFFFWLLSVFIDLLQIILQTWYKNTNHLATCDHLPRWKLFRYLFLPVHMDNSLFIILHSKSGIIYHIMLKTLRCLVNLSLLWKHIYLLWHIWMILLVLIFTLFFMNVC